MTPDVNETEGRPETAEQDLTQRIGASTAERPDAAEPEERKTVFGSLQEAYRRARDGRKAAQPARQPERQRPWTEAKPCCFLPSRSSSWPLCFWGCSLARAARRTAPLTERNRVWTGRGVRRRGGSEAWVRDAVAERGHERTGREHRSDQRG